MNTISTDPKTSFPATGVSPLRTGFITQRFENSPTPSRKEKIENGLKEALKSRGIDPSALTKQQMRLMQNAVLLINMVRSNTDMASLAAKSKQLGLSDISEVKDLKTTDGQKLNGAASADLILIEKALTGGEKADVLIEEIADSLYQNMFGAQSEGDFGQDTVNSINGKTPAGPKASEADSVYIQMPDGQVRSFEANNVGRSQALHASDDRLWYPSRRWSFIEEGQGGTVKVSATENSQFYRELPAGDKIIYGNPNQIHVYYKRGETWLDYKSRVIDEVNKNILTVKFLRGMKAKFRASSPELRAQVLVHGTQAGLPGIQAAIQGNDPILSFREDFIKGLKAHEIDRIVNAELKRSGLAQLVKNRHEHQNPTAYPAKWSTVELYNYDPADEYFAERERRIPTEREGLLVNSVQNSGVFVIDTTRSPAVQVQQYIDKYAPDLDRKWAALLEKTNKPYMVGSSPDNLRSSIYAKVRENDWPSVRALIESYEIPTPLTASQLYARATVIDVRYGSGVEYLQAKKRTATLQQIEDLLVGEHPEKAKILMRDAYLEALADENYNVAESFPSSTFEGTSPYVHGRVAPHSTSRTVKAGAGKFTQANLESHIIDHLASISPENRGAITFEDIEARAATIFTQIEENHGTTGEFHITTATMRPSSTLFTLEQASMTAAEVGLFMEEAATGYFGFVLEMTLAEVTIDPPLLMIMVNPVAFEAANLFVNLAAKGLDKATGGRLTRFFQGPPPPQPFMLQMYNEYKDKAKNGLLAESEVSKLASIVKDHKPKDIQIHISRDGGLGNNAITQTLSFAEFDHLLVGVGSDEEQGRRLGTFLRELDSEDIFPGYGLWRELGKTSAMPAGIMDYINWKMGQMQAARNVNGEFAKAFREAYGYDNYFNDLKHMSSDNYRSRTLTGESYNTYLSGRLHHVMTSGNPNKIKDGKGNPLTMSKLTTD